MRLLAIVALISLACFMLTGCWDMDEITELAPIMGLGFDVGTRLGTIKVSALITPPTRAGADGGAVGVPNLRVLTVEAATVTEALSLLLGHIRREPFLMHLGFLVFGEELARAGIGGVVAGVHGKIEIRGSVLAVVAAGSAEEVLHARSGIGGAPGEDILRLLSNLRRAPLGRLVAFYTVVNTLTGIGSELALPILDLTPLRIEAAGHQPAGGTGQQGQQLMEVSIGRTALFVRDRWVHELDVFQTQIFTLLTGDVDQGAMTIVHPTAPGGVMAVRFLRFRPHFKPHVSPGGSVALHVNIEIDASLTETRGGYDLREYGPKPITTVLEDSVTAQVTALLTLMQQIGSDGLSIGNMIYRRQPTTWGHLEPRWSELYRQMTASVKTKARLRDTSMLARLFAVRRQ
ncbi:MAG: hypothetical protein DDT37_00645 [Firmicutes bacterium]|nr:hypothetical protein [candidate division NPL-UPA2 bacterium]